MNNVKRLPDAYYKGKDGNNYKLLHLNELAADEFSKDLTDVLNCLDLMQATGKTLDLYGEMVEQKRGMLNDTQYRLMILTKIGKNICQGDYNSVIELLTQMFDCKKGDIILKDSTEPCRVEIEKFPLEVLINAGFSSTQAITMIEMLLPVCVKLSNGNFEGTFEFGEIKDTSTTYDELSGLTYDDLNNCTYAELESGFAYCEYDESKGFADVEQTIGGYFGLVLGDENDIVLPI